VEATLELSIPGASSRDASYKMTRVIAIPMGGVVDPNVAAAASP
jgi:hypothetical protein